MKVRHDSLFLFTGKVLHGQHTRKKDSKIHIHTDSLTLLVAIDNTQKCGTTDWTKKYITPWRNKSCTMLDLLLKNDQSFKHYYYLDA